MPRMPGTMRRKEKAIIPNATSIPTCTSSSPTGVFNGSYAVGKGCLRRAFPIVAKLSWKEAESYWGIAFRPYCERAVPIYIHLEMTYKRLYADESEVRRVL